MPTVLQCPQGHQWEPPDSDQADSTCPHCRSQGTPLDVKAPRTMAQPRNVDTVEDADATRSFSDKPAPDATTSHTPKAALPGYEFLEELGHGGMGVVYKARQVALKRLVAVKMILSGAHARESERVRFRREAEAVARLQHPHIVQIHEIGEHDGNLYITLEMVEGGSLLKKLAKQPQPALYAAAHVEMLARAIHYAHQRGIIHRDLKPANVLLTADGTPKITDFGLAKQLDSEEGQTKSGAILGTPSYMAPEQAEGRADAASPLIDVYALGAILYQMLTGRPPFEGDTQLETLRRVVAEEPIPPSRLQSKIPRDLETICFKALAKIPEQRYPTALALAEDLARFQAGDPIVARRTSRLVRVGRYLRRRPLAVAFSAAVLGVVLLTAFFLFRDRLYSRTDALVKQLDQQIDMRDWTRAHADSLDGPLAELEQLDPERARVARGRIQRRTAEAIRQSFAMSTRPVMRDEDIQAVEEEIAFLAKRDEALAQEVRKDLQIRLRASSYKQLVFPFENRADFFQPADVQIKGKHLEIVAGDDKRMPTIATRIASQGKVSMTVVFAGPSWETAGSLALTLNARGDEGYQFELLPVLILSAATTEESEKRTTFAAARKAKGLVRARILRNGGVLREEDIPATNLGEGRLEVTVGRDGDRLSLQVHSATPILFFDGFPLSGVDPGVFALRCPRGTMLEQVTFSHQLLPGIASPLERGDLLYAESKFSDALKFYQVQETPPIDTPAGQEVRYKRGACLLALNRLEEAAAPFEEVLRAEGPRWPAMAGCQLWSIRYRQRKYGDVDAIFLNLSARYPPATLVTMVPEAVRSHFYLAFTVDNMREDFMRFDPQRVTRLERITTLAAAIRIDHRRRLQVGLAMVRAYHLDGQFDAGIEFAQKLLADPGPSAKDTNEVTSIDYRIRMCEEYGNLMRLRGRSHEAMEEMDSRLFSEPGVYRMPYWPLLLERARLRIALNQWEQAETDLTTYLSKKDVFRRDYRYYAEASFVLGFLRERRGDMGGAKAAWSQAVHSTWLERRSKAYPGETFNDHALTGAPFATHLIVASLAEELKEQDTKVLTKMALAQVVDPGSAFLFQDYFQVPPAMLTKAWQSPRGMAAARKMAYKNITWPEYVRSLPILTGFAFIRQNALPAEASAEQEELAWDAAEKVFDAAVTKGTLSKGDVLPLALTWKGITGSLGWSGVSAKLDPSLRGPLAYVMGQRLLRLNNPEASSLFRTALADAPANSNLGRLAQTEIDRLKK